MLQQLSTIAEYLALNILFVFNTLPLRAKPSLPQLATLSPDNQDELFNFKINFQKQKKHWYSSKKKSFSQLQL